MPGILASLRDQLIGQPLPCGHMRPDDGLSTPDRLPGRGNPNRTLFQNEYKLVPHVDAESFAVFGRNHQTATFSELCQSLSPGASAPGYRDVARRAIRFREATFR
jgi:hypothetical protein